MVARAVSPTTSTSSRGLPLAAARAAALSDAQQRLRRGVDLAQVGAGGLQVVARRQLQPQLAVVAKQRGEVLVGAQRHQQQHRAAEQQR
jgi:hypothetical protein